MKKWSFVLWCVIILFASCSQNRRNYVVDVELKGLDKAVFAIHRMYDGKIRIDTLFANNNFFRINGNSDSLVLLNVTDVHGSRLFSLYVQNGDRIRIDGSIDDWYNIKVSDSPLNEELQKFRKEFRPLLEKKIKVQNERIYTTAEKVNRIRQLDFLADSIQSEIKKEIIRYIGNNRGNVISTILLREYLLDEKIYDTTDSLYALLKPQAKINIPVVTNDIKYFLQSVGKGRIGDKAIDFFLNDESDDIFNSMYLEGKTAVLHFWSPRTGISYTDRRTINQLNEFFNDTVLAVVNIAFETDTALWKNFLRKTPLDGYNAIQPQEFASDLASAYGIRYLPVTIVLNKQGYIVDRNIQGIFLIDKIKNMIEDKTPYIVPVKSVNKETKESEWLKNYFNVSFVPDNFVRFEDGSIQQKFVDPETSYLLPLKSDFVCKTSFMERGKHYVVKSK